MGLVTIQLVVALIATNGDVIVADVTAFTAAIGAVIVASVVAVAYMAGAATVADVVAVTLTTGAIASIFTGEVIFTSPVGFIRISHSLAVPMLWTITASCVEWKGAIALFVD